MTKQVAGLQEHIEEIERICSGIRSMKHDMKNTISVIRRLFMENGSEEFSSGRKGVYFVRDDKK